MQNRREKPNSRLEIIYQPIEALTFDPLHPRKYTKKHLHELAQSILTFGFVSPALTSGNAVKIGTGRVKAAIQAGIREIPTIDITYLSHAEQQALAIADNRLTENGTWDERLLAERLSDLSKLELDFSLEVTGFEMGEIDFKIESLNTPLETEEIEPDRSQPVISKLGDVWKLRHHRICNANTIEPNALDALMNGAKASMVIADEPYNVPINGHVSTKGTKQYRDFAMATGEMNSDEFVEFLTKSYAVGKAHSVPGSLHFHFMDWRHIYEATVAGRKVFGEPKSICVWVKNNAGMGSLYRSQHELIVVFKSGSARHQNNVQLGRNGRNRTTVWTYPGSNTYGAGSEEAVWSAAHPTVKPVKLVADAILDCTKRKDIVLDPFLGSGTTLIAAEKTGRRCYGVEIDPLYVDAAIRRWQAYTGDIAIHAVSGQSFDSIARDVDHAA
ncbi:DNA modification methylase [soil metagenome]